MFQIAKQFDFCYGHRVWSQELNCDFSLDSCLKCRHLHGHQGTLIVYLQAEELKKGMVTDFKHLNWFKKWLDDVLDHKMIMDINDPALEFLYSWLFKRDKGVVIDDDLLHMHAAEGYWTIMSGFVKTLPLPIQEVAEGLVFVDFVPTSENLSKWMFRLIKRKMAEIGVEVSRVQFYETPKSQSNYYE